MTHPTYPGARLWTLEHRAVHSYLSTKHREWLDPDAMIWGVTRHTERPSRLMLYVSVSHADGTISFHAKTYHTTIASLLEALGTTGSSICSALFNILHSKLIPVIALASDTSVVSLSLHTSYTRSRSSAHACCSIQLK